MNQYHPVVSNRQFADGAARLVISMMPFLWGASNSKRKLSPAFIYG
jgi:hypothetical protein